MTLPYDFARCTTTGCKLAECCARKEPGNPSAPQPVAQFAGGNHCHGFIKRDDHE